MTEMRIFSPENANSKSGYCSMVFPNRNGDAIDKVADINIRIVPLKLLISIVLSRSE